MVRTLPFHVAPVDGEGVDSWLVAIATRMGCCWADVRDAVMPHRRAGERRTHAVRGFVTALRDDERCSISVATGIDTLRLDAMTLAGVVGGDVIEIDPQTRRASTPWGYVYRQRFCPQCLKSAPGRFRLEWRLPWITTCAEHRCLLADFCPSCGHIQRVDPYWLTAGMLVDSRCCQRQHVRSGGNCTGLLADTSTWTLSRHNPVLAMQQTLRELLALKTIDIGVYQDFPVTPRQLLIDVRALGNRILATTTPSDLLYLLHIRRSASVQARWNELIWTPPPQTHTPHPTIVSNASAALVAAGTAAALTCLMHPSIAKAGDTLREAYESRPMPPIAASAGRRKDPPTPVISAIDIEAHKPSLTVVEHFTYRTFSNLPCLPQARRYASEVPLLCAIPTLFWPELTLPLYAGKLRWQTTRQVLSWLLLAVGSRLSQRRAVSELRTRSTLQLSNAANEMAGHRHWHDVGCALLAVHDYLADNPPPIDYQRRRTINYDGLLPEGVWVDLRRQEGLATTTHTAAAARLWLTERISGITADNRPTTPRNSTICIDRVLLSLTPRMLAALDQHALEFLSDKGIRGEPLIWATPTTLLEGFELPGVPVESIPARAIHELAGPRIKLQHIACELGVSPWLVRHQLDRHPIPSQRSEDAATRPPNRSRFATPGIVERTKAALPKETLRRLHLDDHLPFTQIARNLGLANSDCISDIARLYGIPSARMRRQDRVTPEWLYTEYVVKGRTLTEMAEEVQLSAATIAAWAARYGIEPPPQQRWRQRTDPRTVNVLTRLGLFDAVTPAMKNTSTWNRLQRFANASKHASFTRAAAALKCRPSTLAHQIGTLEQNLGQLLFIRATPGRRPSPMSLTPFGTHVLKAIDQAERTHVADSEPRR